MAIGFPANTVLVILALMVGTGVGSWFLLSDGLRRSAIEPHTGRRWRWGAALVLGAWLLARLALGANPPGATVLGTPYSFLSFSSFGLGVLTGVAALLISPVFRRAVRETPASWLVRLHGIRAGGFAWLALLDMRLLPAEFALPTGYGDMTVGLSALVVAHFLDGGRPHARPLAIGWNVLGLLDFAVAFSTAFAYLGPFAAQLAASGASLRYLNYVLLIPSFGVSLFSLLHVYSLFQLVSPEQRARAAEHHP